MKKSTRAVLLDPRAAKGHVLLDVWPDIIKTQPQADFYVGQTRYVVERVVDHDEQNRTVYLKHPISEEAKP